MENVATSVRVNGNSVDHVFVSVPTSPVSLGSEATARNHAVIITIFNQAVTDIRNRGVCHFDILSLMNLSLVNKTAYGEALNSAHKEKSVWSILLLALTENGKMRKEITKLTSENVKKILEELIYSNIYLEYKIDDSISLCFDFVFSALHNHCDKLIELLINSGVVEEGYVLLLERLMQGNESFNYMKELPLSEKNSLRKDIDRFISLVNVKGVFEEQVMMNGGATDNAALARLARNNHCYHLFNVFDTERGCSYKSPAFLRRRQAQNRDLALGVGMLSTALIAGILLVAVSILSKMR